MAPKVATPLHIIESYFKTKLNKSAIKRLIRLDDENKWVDFALYYLETMKEHFVADFLEVEGEQAPLRLYFEPRLRVQWDAAVTRLSQSPTPLLGVTPDPEGDDINADAAAMILAPLKKHLLIADSVYVRDSFYYCFDLIEACVNTIGWRDDPNLARQVNYGIRRLKAWLPLLGELRQLIETRALVFMPHYMTPSWPYEVGDTRQFRDAFANLRIQPQADSRPPLPLPHVDFESFFDDAKSHGAAQTGRAQRRPARFNEREVEGAWLNSRLMGLDPVFPNPEMFDFAARLYLAPEDGPGDLTCDLTSLDIVPLGARKPISLETLLDLRKNEEGFTAVRSAVVECQTELKNSLLTDAPRSAAVAICKKHFEDQIAGYAGKKGKVLSFVERPVPSIVFTAAVTVALLPTGIINPLIPALGGIAATPGLLHMIQRRFNPELRAMTSLKALL
jgi:hypothetical protein